MITKYELSYVKDEKHIILGAINTKKEWRFIGAFDKDVSALAELVCDYLNKLLDQSTVLKKMNEYTMAERLTESDLTD